jgi:hypothetical protein
VLPEETEELDLLPLVGISRTESKDEAWVL